LLSDRFTIEEIEHTTKPFMTLNGSLIALPVELQATDPRNGHRSILKGTSAPFDTTIDDSSWLAGRHSADPRCTQSVKVKSLTSAPGSRALAWERHA
jgi:hypothetical protein